MGSMTSEEIVGASGLWQEIEQGLRCAMQAYYVDATNHFLKARTHAPQVQPRFAILIDAFLSSHARYWAAQQVLHTASQSFVVAQADQLARLDELRQLVAEASH